VHGFEGDASRRDMPRRVLLDPQAADRYPDRRPSQPRPSPTLRLGAGRHPDDERLTALIGELSMSSGHFRRLWADHPVKEKTYGVKRIDHPVAGELQLAYETTALPGDADLTVVVCAALPRPAPPCPALPRSAAAERLAVHAGRNAGEWQGAASASADNQQLSKRTEGCWTHHLTCGFP
jgi:hypothetical protein